MEIRRRSLNDLETNIIELLQSFKTYSQIAEKLGYDSGYIGDIAREIYGLIGQKYRVTRTNLFSTLDKFIDSEPEPDFYECHGIKNRLFSSEIIKFKQDEILFNVSLFWKFNASAKSLILKTKNPVVINLDHLTPDQLGKTLINLSRQQQVSGDAVLELLKILDNYFN